MFSKLIIVFLDGNLSNWLGIYVVKVKSLTVAEEMIANLFQSDPPFMKKDSYSALCSN